MSIWCELQIDRQKGRRTDRQTRWQRDKQTLGKRERKAHKQTPLSIIFCFLFSNRISLSFHKLFKSYSPTLFIGYSLAKLDDLFLLFSGMTKCIVSLFFMLRIWISVYFGSYKFRTISCWPFKNSKAQMNYWIKGISLSPSTSPSLYGIVLLGCVCIWHDECAHVCFRGAPLGRPIGRCQVSHPILLGFNDIISYKYTQRRKLLRIRGVFIDIIMTLKTILQSTFIGEVNFSVISIWWGLQSFF